MSTRIQESFASTSQTATGDRAAGDGINANSPLYLHNFGRTSINLLEGAVDRAATEQRLAARLAATIRHCSIEVEHRRGCMLTTRMWKRDLAAARVYLVPSSHAVTRSKHECS